MRRLSASDVAFLLLERRHQPFHVGALSLFRPPKGSAPDIGAQIAARLAQSTHAAPPFDRRLTRKLGISYWEDDDTFDLAHHFVHMSLPKPGRVRELLAMVSRVHSAHLDRAYPLWRTYLIEGLEDGRIATYSKIHHAVVDGVAGIRLMIKSMAPDRAESAQMPPPWEMKARRTRATMPMAAVGEVGAISGLLAQGRESIPGVYRQLRQTVQDFRAKHPDLVTSFQAPRCVLNQPITASRRFAAQSYATARIKSVAAHFDATTNDVILAMCAGALRRYLNDLNELPDKPLIAAVPVSIRRDDSESGNEVAGALVNLATHLSDPLKRFRAIKASMDYNKERFRQMTPAQMLAYMVAMLAPGMLTMIPGFDRKRAVANVVISHVPGPRQTMYWQGCELEGIYPASLLIDGFALNITLISRHDNVDFGIIACRRTLPSVQHLLDHIEESLVELERALR
jgi:diacylglycerol O-acyltransferase